MLADLRIDEGRVEYFANKAAKQLAQNGGKVLFWAKHRANYITPNRKIVLRIRDASKFGEKARCFTRLNGALSTVEWKAALSRFLPNAIEIYGSGNPLPYLIYSLKQVDDLHADNSNTENVASKFFTHLNELSVFQTDVLFTDLAELLGRLSVLAAFSFHQVHFSLAEFDALVGQLERLQLRALALAGGAPNFSLPQLFQRLQLEALSFCPDSGVLVSDLVACDVKSLATRLVYAQEICFEANDSDDDSILLLRQIVRLFPRLETLIWDWTIVEPYDERSISIVHKLIHVYRELNLKAIAIPMYTPYKEILEDVDKMCKIFEVEKLPFQHRRFCSSGVETPNFSLILVGEETGDAGAIIGRICELFVDKKCTRLEELSLLLYVATAEARYKFADDTSTLSLDFGGFDSAQILEKFAAR